MELRRYSPSDYVKVAELWNQYPEWPIIPEAALPTRGMTAWESDELLAAAFLYETDSSICWLEWIVGNAEISPLKRGRAVKAVAQGTIDLAKEAGFQIIFSSVMHPNLMKMYEEMGMIKSDQAMTNFTGVLSQMGEA